MLVCGGTNIETCFLTSKAMLLSCPGRETVSLLFLKNNDILVKGFLQSDCSKLVTLCLRDPIAIGISYPSRLVAASLGILKKTCMYEIQYNVQECGMSSVQLKEIL